MLLKTLESIKIPLTEEQKALMEKMNVQIEDEEDKSEEEKFNDFMRELLYHGMIQSYTTVKFDSDQIKRHLYDFKEKYPERLGEVDLDEFYGKRERSIADEDELVLALTWVI